MCTYLKRCNVYPSINNDWSIKTIKRSPDLQPLYQPQAGWCKTTEQRCEWVKRWTHLTAIEPFNWIKKLGKNCIHLSLELILSQQRDGWLLFSFYIVIQIKQLKDFSCNLEKYGKIVGKQTKHVYIHKAWTDSLHFDWNNSPTIM